MFRALLFVATASSATVFAGDLPSVFTALQEQLGLKLESGVVPSMCSSSIQPSGQRRTEETVTGSLFVSSIRKNL